MTPMGSFSLSAVPHTHTHGERPLRPPQYTAEVRFFVSPVPSIPEWESLNTAFRPRGNLNSLKKSKINNSYSIHSYKALQFLKCLQTHYLLRWGDRFVDPSPDQNPAGGQVEPPAPRPQLFPDTLPQCRALHALWVWPVALMVCSGGLWETSPVALLINRTSLPPHQKLMLREGCAIHCGTWGEAHSQFTSGSQQQAHDGFSGRQSPHDGCSQPSVVRFKSVINSRQRF